MKYLFLIIQFFLLFSLQAEEVLRVRFLSRDNYNPHPLLQESQRRSGEVSSFKEGLDIISTLEKVRLYIFDEDSGLLPYKQDNLKPGTYRIRLEKRGYLTLETFIEIRKDYRTEVFAVMDKDPETALDQLEEDQIAGEEDKLLTVDILRVSPSTLSISDTAILPFTLKVGPGKRDSFILYLDNTEIYSEDISSENLVTVYPDITELDDGSHTIRIEYSLDGEMKSYERDFIIDNISPRRPDNPITGYNSINGPFLSGSAYVQFPWLYNHNSSEHLFPVKVGFSLVPHSRLKFSLNCSFYLDPEDMFQGIAPEVSILFRILQGEMFTGAVKLQYRYWGYSSDFTLTRTDLGIEDLPSLVLSSPWILNLNFLRIYLDPAFQLVTADSMGAGQMTSYQSALLHIIGKGGISAEFRFLQTGLEYTMMTPSLNQPVEPWRHRGSFWFTAVVPRTGFSLSVLYSAEWDTTGFLNQKTGFQFGIKF